MFLDLLQVDLLASGAKFQINPLSTSLIPDQPLLREIYNEHPILSYKRAKSLGDILVTEQNYKVTYHTITNLWVVFGLSTPSTSQSTPCWNLNRKSHFNALSTCGWQLYPQGSLGAILIGPSAPTRFWIGEIRANQVWKVLRPAPYEIRRRNFLKV